MIKKTLYFGNPAYLSLRNDQLVIKLPEVEKNIDNNHFTTTRLNIGNVVDSTAKVRKF